MVFLIYIPTQKIGIKYFLVVIWIVDFSKRKKVKKKKNYIYDIWKFYKFKQIWTI